MSPGATLDVALPRTMLAPRIAREHVRAAVSGRLHPERLADVELAVTELVANAVRHGTGDIGLKLRLDGRRVYGEVIDEGGGFEHAIRERRPSEVTGRGLGIVAALAEEWGVHEGSTHVWFVFHVDDDDADGGATNPQLGDARRPGELS